MVEDILFYYKITDEDEQLAVRLSYFFLKYARKVSPDCLWARISSKTDPRNSVVFKHCYKMVNERRDFLPEDLFLFIRAQLDILTLNSEAYAGPACLNGERALKRWYVWKKRYEAAIVSQYVTEAAVETCSERKIQESLLETKNILIRKLGKIDINDMQRLADNGTLYRWLKTGVVCGWFVSLLNVKHNEKYAFDSNDYKGIDESIKAFFHQEFLSAV